MARAYRRTKDSRKFADADASIATAIVEAVASPVASGTIDGNAGERSGSQPALQGTIDTATWTSIEGWVWDPGAPERAVAIELLEDGIQQATAFADEPRPDLVQAGIGDGRHGFKIHLPPGVMKDRRHTLHLQCADSGAVVPGSPVTLEPPAAEPATTLRYHLDEITDSGIFGWICDIKDPARRCVVLLKEGGQTLARATAAAFRPDLLSAGIGNGCYGFTLEMPGSLLDGAEHWLDVIEEETGFLLNGKHLRWRSAWGTARPASPAAAPSRDNADVVPDDVVPSGSASRGTPTHGNAGAHVRTCMLFDISDLVYYIGHHPNLTGIQRVQSSIVLAMINGAVAGQAGTVFLSFNAHIRRWTRIPTGFLANLLQDLFLPEAQRLISFPAEEARYGHLPGAREFDGTGVLDCGTPSVLCLLGAAWVQSDYFHRILSLKRRFGTRFVMMVHDLIPIYARETCDQGTAQVFDEFLRRSLRHVDHYLSVSENTARDLRRYVAAAGLPEPAITVSRNGSSFDEFLPGLSPLSPADTDNLPDRFVLFVSTIEGRKNHQLMLDVWRRMLAEGDNPPHLVCVGRVGWRSERFVAELVESDYLDGKVVLLQEISDEQLKWLYDHALFTVYPSLYEGWGLPVGESLAAGKVCVLSDRASLPEVAGEFGVYIDVDDREQSWRVVRDLIFDDALRDRLEQKIRADYRPITWTAVATKIVSACEAATAIPWQPPYPYGTIPYGTEISFANLSREADATFGDGLLNRITGARRGHFLPAPLQEISFLRGEDARAGGIWAEPENWGTWLCYATGDLVIGLPANESTLYYVFLRLRASGPVANLQVQLQANGEPAWQGRIGPLSRDILVRVRKRLRGPAGAGWQVKLHVETELLADVRREIAAVDGRVPTIGFERLVVVPENDLTTRLELLTNMLMMSAE